MTNLINTIGMEKLLFALVAAIPFVFLVAVNIILVRKNYKTLRLKVFLSENKLVLLAIFVSTFIIASTVALVGYYQTTPQILSSNPATGENWNNYDKPIEVTFNVPVAISSLEPRMTPKLEGQWVWEKFLFSDYTVKGKFYPKQTYLPEQRIVIYIVGAKRLFINDENHELALNFFSPKNVEVISSYPKNYEANFNREESIKLLLSKNNFHLSNWSYRLEPNIELELVNPHSSVLEFKAKAPLDADTDYKLILKRKPIRYDLQTSQVLEQIEEADYVFTLDFKTLKEPFVEKFAPQGTGILNSTKIKVTFTLPMKKQSVQSNFSINPNVEGIFDWVDDNSFIFIPTMLLEKGTKYDVQFKKGIESMDQGPTYRDLNYSFETVGAIKITGSDPSNGNNRVGENASIRIGIDQEVDHASAQANFTMFPAVAGSFSWDKNDMIFTPSSSLSYNQPYTITLLKGVKSIYGLDLAEDYSLAFTVRGQEMIIGGVPQIYQPYGSFSCNLYAGIMGLAWKGFNLSATAVIAETGYNPNQSNGNWSGNPYNEYVGNSDGSWGYGIYWPAIQRVFSNRGISTEVKEGWNKYALAASIINGNPVVIWRYNGESSNYDKNWTAADGTYIRGINGQHGGIVIGLKGPTNNPEAFLVNDPWYGQTWYDADYLDYTWSRMNRTALVIY